MYNPPSFKSEDPKEAFGSMDRYPFATLITVVDGNPQVSLLPMTPRERDGHIELLGHLARANVHWKSLAGAQAMVVFHGPHAYITPSWYAENDVPTWNYLAIQASGKVELIEDADGVIACVQELTRHAERHWPSGWEFYLPEDLGRDVLPKRIVGFRIRLESIEFKKKLNQRNSVPDRAGVLKGLQTRSDGQSRELLEEMLKIYSEDGELKTR